MQKIDCDQKNPLPNHILVMLCLLLFILIVDNGQSVWAQSTENIQADSAQLTTGEKETIREDLADVILQKLAFYASQYPDMNFIVLDSAADLRKNIQVLARVIGEDPVPEDYAHPLNLRETLLSVTIDRIATMLATRMVSSTLFKTGKNALAKRSHVCVVTIDPWGIARDDRAATEHLLSLSDDEFLTIPSSKYLEHFSHLQYTLDHEIYHCLDSRLNGPIPMSSHEFWGGYSSYKNELGADAFAVMMNIGTHNGVTAYAKTLNNIRGLALLTGDFDHLTHGVIAEVLEMNPDKIVRANVYERFRLASEMRSRFAGSYEDYISYSTAAKYVFRHLHGRKEMEKNTDKPDEDRVQALLAETHQAYRNLTGHDLKCDR